MSSVGTHSVVGSTGPLDDAGNSQKVYVEYPIDDDDDYRFVSSRMEDPDHNPVLGGEDILPRSNQITPSLVSRERSQARSNGYPPSSHAVTPARSVANQPHEFDLVTETPQQRSRQSNQRQHSNPQSEDIRSRQGSHVSKNPSHLSNTDHGDSRYQNYAEPEIILSKQGTHLDERNSSYSGQPDLLSRHDSYNHNSKPGSRIAEPQHDVHSKSSKHGDQSPVHPPPMSDQKLSRHGSELSSKQPHLSDAEMYHLSRQGSQAHNSQNSHTVSDAQQFSRQSSQQLSEEVVAEISRHNSQHLSNSRHNSHLGSQPIASPQSGIIHVTSQSNLQGSRQSSKPSSRELVKRQSSSKVPPLDLVSQTSSVDMSGAKGSIDINLRSDTDDDDEEDDEELEVTPKFTDSLDMGNPEDANEANGYATMESLVKQGQQNLLVRDVNEVLSRMTDQDEVGNLTLQKDLYDTSRNPPDSTENNTMSARTFGDTEPVGVVDLDFLRKLKADFVYAAAPSGPILPLQNYQHQTTQPMPVYNSYGEILDDEGDFNSYQQQPVEVKPQKLTSQTSQSKRSRQVGHVTQENRMVTVSAPPQFPPKGLGGKHTGFGAKPVAPPASAIDHIERNKFAVSNVAPPPNYTSYNQIYRGHKETKKTVANKQPLRRQPSSENSQHHQAHTAPNSAGNNGGYYPEDVPDLNVEEFWLTRARFLANQGEYTPSKKPAAAVPVAHNPPMFEVTQNSPSIYYQSPVVNSNSLYHHQQPDPQLALGQRQHSPQFYPTESHVIYDPPPPLQPQKGGWTNQNSANGSVSHSVRQTSHDETAWREIEEEATRASQQLQQQPTLPQPISPRQQYHQHPIRYDTNQLEREFHHLSPSPPPILTNQNATSGGSNNSTHRYPPLPPISSPKREVQIPFSYNRNAAGDPSTGGSYAAQHSRDRDGVKPKYQRYTLRDFQNFRNNERMGGLGPNTETSEFQTKREMTNKQREYAQRVRFEHEKRLRQSKHTKAVHHPAADQSETDVSQRATSPSAFRPWHHESPKHEVNSPAQEERKDGEGGTNFGEEFSEDTVAIMNRPTKRQVMLDYSKNLRKKEPSEGQHQPTSVRKKENPHPVDQRKRELVSNSELDKLLQRHEEDKRNAEAIRQTVSKV